MLIAEQSPPPHEHLSEQGLGLGEVALVAQHLGQALPNSEGLQVVHPVELLAPAVDLGVDRLGLLNAPGGPVTVAQAATSAQRVLVPLAERRAPGGGEILAELRGLVAAADAPQHAGEALQAPSGLGVRPVPRILQAFGTGPADAEGAQRVDADAARHTVAAALLGHRGQGGHDRSGDVGRLVADRYVARRVRDEVLMDEEWHTICRAARHGAAPTPCA
mmetsp:Transcript_124601/g.360398  ORF Transcript_124601/g.360398 Transcript_124601/m.360398 type:complete len:219 (+) Transcript_124601:1398-2054(+)